MKIPCILSLALSLIGFANSVEAQFVWTPSWDFRYALFSSPSHNVSFTGPSTWYSNGDLIKKNPDTGYDSVSANTIGLALSEMLDKPYATRASLPLMNVNYGGDLAQPKTYMQSQVFFGPEWKGKIVNSFGDPILTGIHGIYVCKLNEPRFIENSRFCVRFYTLNKFYDALVEARGVVIGPLWINTSSSEPPDTQLFYAGDFPTSSSQRIAIQFHITKVSYGRLQSLLD